MITAVIIDDDAASVSALAEALERTGRVQVAGTASSPRGGATLIDSARPDVVFLDMLFPDADGAEWLAQHPLPEGCKAVFYTAYRTYIHSAMRMRVFDFLLKPIDPADISIILSRLEGEKSSDTASARPMPRAEGGALRKPMAVTTVTNSKIILSPSDILYFRYHSDRKMWEVVLSTLKRHLLKRQTTATDILATDPRFVRTHKRFIINLDYLGVVEGQDCVFLPPYDSIDEVKISKTWRRHLLEQLYDI